VGLVADQGVGDPVGAVPDRHTIVACADHARSLLVDAAWHYRAHYRPRKIMRERWELAPAVACLRGDAGNPRLHERWVQFNPRKKRPAVANVAIARELARWC
jgi:transposase